MAIKTGEIFNSLVFGGVNSADYGIYITGEGVFNAPKRAVNMVAVPGRNGSIAIDQGHWENIEVTYPAGTFGMDEQEFRTALSNFRNAIASQVGYQRLTDTYHPDEYRMAIYMDGLEVEPTTCNKAGEFDLKFDCKPQRWLTAGEVPVTIGEWGATQEASGEIVTIESEGGEAAKSLVVTLEPIQAGSGDPSPDNVRPISGRTEVVTSVAGKNLLPMTLASLKAVNTSATWSGNTYTRNGIAFTVLTDASDNVTGIRADGTATAETTFYQVYNTKLPLASGQYAFNGCPSGGGGTTYRMQLRNGQEWFGETGSGRTFTYDASTSDTDLVRIDILNGATCNNVVFKPMIRLASDTDSTYEPYNGRTYTTALGRTVYGGALDVVSGVLTVDMTFRTFDGSENWETINQGLRLAGGFGGKAYSAKNVSNMLTYATGDPTINPNSYQFTVGGFVNVGVPYTVAEWKSLLATTNLQVVYELATPQTYQLTPQQVTLLVGENHVWSDGSITMQYGDDPNSLYNPTQYDAGPLLAIEGNGTVQLGQSRLDVSDGILGTYVVAENHQFMTTVRYWGSSLEIDPYFNSGDKFSLGKVEVTELIEDTNGNIFTEVSNISLSEGTSVSFEGNTLRIRTVFDYGEFTVGSGYTNRSREISFDVKNASGKIDTATFGIGFTYSNLGDLFVSGYITSVVPASGSTGFDFSANYLYSSVVAKKISGFSTRSVGSLTKYVDCETGESYVMLGDRIISNNRNISLPVDLPVLTSGANAISFSNTITDLKITPRWWKL